MALIRQEPGKYLVVVSPPCLEGCPDLALKETPFVNRAGREKNQYKIRLLDRIRDNTAPLLTGQQVPLIHPRFQSQAASWS